MHSKTSQRSYEWYLKRLGKVTASEFYRIRSFRSRQTYAAQIRDELSLLKQINAGEDILLGPNFTSAATDWGIRQEPAARAAYEFNNDTDLELVDFVIHPVLPFVGCSPDGLRKDALGGVEIKCPYNPMVHRRTLASGAMPDGHIPQVQGQIAVQGLEWNDFVSFDPRANPSSQYFQVRVYRDDAFIRDLELALCDFWDLVHSGKDKTPNIFSGEVPQLF